jgi:hypothetical protein
MRRVFADGQPVKALRPEGAEMLKNTGNRAGLGRLQLTCDSEALRHTDGTNGQ